MQDNTEVLKSRLANSPQWCTQPCVSAPPCVQGVKFYDSVVQGDTPEAVDFRGIQNLAAAVQQHVGTMGGVTVFSAGGQVTRVQGQCRPVPGQAVLQAEESGPLKAFVMLAPLLVYGYA